MTLKNLTFLLLCGTAVGAFAQQPHATVAHGFYDNPFQVEFTPEDGDDLFAQCRIRYTLDGSMPTAKSAIYSAPLQVKKNTLLRAAYERADTLASPVTTVTYLFMNDVLAAPDVPSGYPSQWGNYCEKSGTAKGDYGMDGELLADASFRQKVIQGLQALPTLSIVTDKNNLFSHDRDEETGGIYIYTGTPVGDDVGRDWVRPISLEMFGAGEELDFTVNCGTKIHGGHSRLPEKSPKHSFRLMFSEKYGGPGKLKCRLFGKEGPKKHNQLVLRCMFGSTWTHWDGSNRNRAQYERDMWARAMQQLMGHPSARGRYVNLYLNGMYWGIYNIAERVNDNYCSSNFDGDNEDYDVIKVEEQLGHAVVPGDGTIDKWNAMMALVKKAGSGNTYDSRDAYLKLTGLDAQGQPNPKGEVLLDIDNFIDYMLINLYDGNDDWDHHNWLAFKNRKDSTQGFRFICWDSEVIFTSNNYDLCFTKSNDNCSTYMFHQLMENYAFRHRFTDRAYRHLVAKDGFLSPERVVAVWDSLYQIIEYPLYAESARWGDYRRDVHPYTSSSNTVYRPDGKEFQKERNRLLTDYFPARTSFTLQTLKSKGLYSNVSAPTVWVNGVKVLQPDTLHYGDVLTLGTSQTAYYTIDGVEPVCWEASIVGKRTESCKEYVNGYNILKDVDWSQGKLTLWVVARGVSDYSPMVERTFVLDSSSSLETVHTPSDDRPQGTYDLLGRRVNEDDLSRGLYLRHGKKVFVK